MTTVSEALAYTKDQVEQILEKLKFKNGERLNTDEFAKLEKSRVVFWINRAQIQDTNRSIFISVIVNNPEARGRADKRVGFRKCRAYIDIITSKPETDKTLMSTIEKIENAFLEAEWNFELVRSPEKDDRSDKTTWTFEIEKTL